MAIGTDERSNAGADTKKSERIYGDGSNGRIYGEQTQNEKTEEAEEAEEESKEMSPLKKAAVVGAVGVAAGIGATAAVAHKTRTGLHNLENSVAGAIDAVVMDRTGPLDRRLPAIGVMSPKEDNELSR